MAEREALQWQIQLLQNLIDRHKRVHGDATVPFSEAHTRTGSTSSTAGTGRGTTAGTGPGTTAVTRLGASLTFLGGAHSLSSSQKPRSSCGFMLGPRSQSGSWRKTYSLKNNISLASLQTQTQRQSQSTTPKTALKPPAASQRPQPHLGPDSASDLPPRSTASTQGLQTNKPTTAALKPDKTLNRPSQSQNKTSELGSFFSYSCNSSLKHPTSPSTKTPSPASLKDLTSENDPKTKTRVSSALENASTESQRCVNFSNPSDPEGKTLLSKQNATASVKPTEMKKSLSAPLNGLKPEGSSSVSGFPASAANSGTHSNLRKRASPRASAPSALKRVKNCSDTTCFTWVRPAPDTGKHRQGLSPGSESSGGDSDPSRRHSLSALSGTSSRYQWVSRVNRPRPGPGLSPQVSSNPGPKVRPKDRSRFKWSAPQRSEVTAGLAAVAVETGGSSGFKLQSRTMIISRNSPGPSVVLTPSGRKPGLKPRSGTVKTHISVSRHKLRRISPVQTRTTDLVSVSRHKLRRTRTGSGVSLPQRVFWSRFKMEKRAVVSPDLGWRSRRVQMDKTFRQIRLRSQASDQARARPIMSQGWSSNVCWIRGSLYRVSANRLSRTTARNTLGKPPTGSTHLFPAAAVARSSSRYMAKSVLQRSLSIARTSHLKQRQRQFCMFYNRFGRCNRGDQCPFIHDPEKVAVCTRFLRGRCKEDDSCQFSHKVSKDKMPVCSFFLRGICSNSECPYSHVYVSRNAQICQDFVRGYCPLGQKCKKKHTLVCSDANCRRGDACRLQHKLIRCSAGRKPHPHSKRNKLLPQTSDPASVLNPRPGSGLSPCSSPRPRPLQKLPSFISLCSSPEEPEAPQTTGGAAIHKGRILQIKPRL